MSRCNARSVLGLSAGLLALASGLAAGPADASDECGPQTGTVVTCTSANNPNASGITYAATRDLTLKLAPDILVDTSSTHARGLTIGGTRNTSNVEIDGAGSSIVTAGATAVTVATGSGNLALNLGSIQTSGSNAAGINAASSTGDVSVSAQSIATTGSGASGVIVASSSGSVAVTNAGMISTEGTAAYGIYARGPAGVTVGGGGNITTTGGSATAVLVASTTGDVVLDLGDINTSGDNAPGVNVASSAGNISVSAKSATTTGAGSSAILAQATNGTVSVANDGAISTAGSTAYGIYARGAAGVTIAGQGSVATKGDGANAIDLISSAGAIDVTQGTVSTTGAGAIGINAATTNGDISVSAGSIITAGSSASGIVAQSSGGGDVSVSTQSVTTKGRSAAGILATSGTGSVAVINAGMISTEGAGAYGIYARGPAGLTVSGGGGVTTTGGNATAVLVASTTGNVVIDLGDIRTSGDNAPGVNVASSAGNISVSAKSVTTTGAGSSAILAQATNGTVSVANDGAISTTGSTAYGIYARGAAGVTIAGQGSVATKGDGANAIDLISSAGAIDVTQGTVSTAGAGAIGIRVSATRDAHVTVDSVSTAGSDAIAISTLSASGDASVSLTGKVRSANSIGVAINAKTLATLDLAAGAVLDGATGAAIIASGTGTVINNAGTIGPVGAAKLAAVTITATGGPVTINNAGTINGNLLLGAGNDVVMNTGTFNAVANSDLKGGNDLFDNRGSFHVAPFATAPTTVNLASLETFRNAGAVDFRNGHIGDQLILQGDYVGANGVIYLDIDPTNLAGSDLIQVSGSVTGNTIVSLNRINDKALTLNYGTPIVKVGAASEAGAFALDPAEQSVSGLIGLGIKYDAGNLSYDLVAMPGDAAYRTLAISAGVRNLWIQSADAWSARMRQLRDVQRLSADRAKPGIWGQLVGQRQTRDVDQTTTVFGVSRPIGISYAQDEIGGQLGIDFRSHLDGAPVYGITGGYLHSTLTYDRVADRVTFDDLNLGAYFGYQSGSIFFNLLGKYDMYWAHNSSVSGGYSSAPNGASYGVQAELGGRLGGKVLFFEPHVSVAASHGRIDDFAVPAGRFRFDDPDGLTLKAGGRIGSSFTMGERVDAALFVRADYVDEVMGKDRVVFSSGGTNAALEMDAASPYGEGAIGLTVSSKSGMGLSVEGRYAKGSDSDGFGGRMTLNITF